MFCSVVFNKQLLFADYLKKAMCGLSFQRALEALNVTLSKGGAQFFDRLVSLLSFGIHGCL